MPTDALQLVAVAIAAAFGLRASARDGPGAPIVGDGALLIAGSAALALGWMFLVAAPFTGEAQTRVASAGWVLGALALGIGEAKVLYDHRGTLRPRRLVAYAVLVSSYLIVAVPLGFGVLTQLGGDLTALQSSVDRVSPILAGGLYVFLAVNAGELLFPVTPMKRRATTATQQQLPSGGRVERGIP